MYFIIIIIIFTILEKNTSGNLKYSLFDKNNRVLLFIKLNVKEKKSQFIILTQN